MFLMLRIVAAETAVKMVRVRNQKEKEARMSQVHVLCNLYTFFRSHPSVSTSHRQFRFRGGCTERSFLNKSRSYRAVKAIPSLLFATYRGLEGQGLGLAARVSFPSSSQFWQRLSHRNNNSRRVGGEREHKCLPAKRQSRLVWALT